MSNFIAVNIHIFCCRCCCCCYSSVWDKQRHAAMIFIQWRWKQKYITHIRTRMQETETQEKAKHTTHTHTRNVPVHFVWFPCFCLDAIQDALYALFLLMWKIVDELKFDNYYKLGKRMENKCIVYLTFQFILFYSAPFSCVFFFYIFFFCINSLHLLSVLLVIHHINSTNINEPLIDNHTTAINIVANEEQMPSMPLPSSLSSSNEYNARKINKSTATTMTTVNNDSFDKSRPSSTRNQSIESPRSVINPIIDNTHNNFTEHIQIYNRSSSSLNMQPAGKKSMTTSNGGKVYNKNDLRKRKIKSTGIDQLTIDDWKCPNISENSRYLECGCDIPYTLRCSGDIHGLQQIAHGLRQSKYPVSLLDCTLKNVTFLSDARIFDNVSLHGLVISSGEIKRVHRHAFLGLKMPLQALGLPNNALTNVPAHSLSALTSLDRLDLSNNRIKYLGPSDFLVCF